MIQQWNNTVTNEDIIIHLGDFALCNSEKLKEYASKLNGIKYLIKGNHDHSTNTFYENTNFRILPHGYKLEFDNEKYILSHKPLMDIQIPKEYINIHGHIHNSILNCAFNKVIHKCVSVECLDDYKPMMLIKHINLI